MNLKLDIVIVGRNQAWAETTAMALRALSDDNLIFTPSVKYPKQSAHKITNLIHEKARTFLATLKTPVKVTLLCAPSLSYAKELIDGCSEPGTIGMTFCRADSIMGVMHQADAAEEILHTFYDDLQSSGVNTMRTPYSDAVFISEEEYLASPYQNSLQYRVRVLDKQPEFAEAEVASLFLNYLQHIFTNRLAQRRLIAAETPVALGVQLVHCMQRRFSHDWILSYFTGSIVASLIKSIEEVAGEALVIRGPSEHALACGAFIHARLYNRGYLLLLTSAMIDELKGTLANLQQLRARGIILCADATESKWFGFQATVNSDADVRTVLTARNIPWVYLKDPEQLAEGIEQIAYHLDQASGPVVLIATQSVLESRQLLAELPKLEPIPPAKIEAVTSYDAQLEQALDIINNGPDRLFWVCGALTQQEKILALAIAEKAGIALGDCLSAPGFMPAFVNGKRHSCYVGTLGQYGTSQEVFRYLMADGSLRPIEDQCLFVLKGKLGQIDSPFSDNDHLRRLKIVQINRNQNHIAPFSNIGIALPVLDFLQYIHARLDVNPRLLERRLAALAQAKDWRGDVLGEIPSLPMTPNYFYARLRATMEHLITEHDYRYVGLFDVGHNGTLAVRYLPRTGPCYSGWYGRGLMGDSLQATGALIPYPTESILSISGDGARQITSDILPGIVENLLERRCPIGKNVTIFYAVNNSFSVINSYVQRIMFKDGGRQMVVANPEAFVEPDAEMIVHGTTIVRRRLLRIDETELAQAMLAQNRINIFTVPLLNNDDGVSILDIGNWQY